MLLSSACGGLPREHRFEYQHLRALDPAETHLPEMDLIALYYSTAGDETHLRIDLLDFQDSSEFDLYIAFDSRPGGSRQLPFIDCASLDWDLLIRVPASGSPDLFNASLEPSLAENIRVQKDSTLDIISLSIPPSLLDLPGPVRVQVFTSFPGGDQAIDTLGPVLTDMHPPQRVNLLLTFWNVFSSHTPAQALRTWSGAHTGPSGERFGLHHLLDAVNETGIPVTLLDAKNPQTLAGLDYLGVLGQVQALDHRGLLTLPDSLPAASALPEWLIERIITTDLDSVHAFGFSSSPITAMITEEPDKDAIELLRKLGYKALFSPINKSSGAGPSYPLTRSGPLLLLPLPPTSTDRSHSSDRGLSVDWRKSLLAAAMDGGDSTVVSLGGDFSKTFWGDPQQSKNMLRWIAAHPWIHPVSPEEIIRDHFPAPEVIILDSAHFERRAYIPVGVNGQPISSGYTYDLIRALVQDGLLSFGNSPLAESAWRMYINTQISNEEFAEKVDALGSVPTFSESNDRITLDFLRANSIGRTGIFLSALRWAQTLITDPTSSEQIIKMEDIDWDGDPEAILQNDCLYAVVTPEGGRLAALFGYDPQLGAVQLIGGRPHVDIGLSDIHYWDPLGGEIGEKTEPLLDGAFTSLANAAVQFELINEGDSLLAIHPDGHYTLRYRLQNDQLMIDVSPNENDISLEIPLLLNPSRLRQPTWRLAYRQIVEKHRISWSIHDGPGFSVTSDNAPMSFSSFLDSPAY
ncbi:MAG: hypothetical protein KAI06_02225, partial [Anaerolineales bacterium]|nr:hypothetical protein [Anaerolineales bacterium]